jgi:hypothetical protein
LLTTTKKNILNCQIQQKITNESQQIKEIKKELQQNKNQSTSTKKLPLTTLPCLFKTIRSHPESGKARKIGRSNLWVQKSTKAYHSSRLFSAPQGVFFSGQFQGGKALILCELLTHCRVLLSGMIEGH